MLYIDEKATPYRPPRGFPYKYEQKGIPLTRGQNGGIEATCCHLHIYGHKNKVFVSRRRVRA